MPKRQGTAIRWVVTHGNPSIEVARRVRGADANLAVVARSRPQPATGVVGTVAEAILELTLTNAHVLIVSAAGVLRDDQAAAQPALASA